MSQGNCDDCTTYYLVTVALVGVLWLAAAAVAFWYLKVRKAGGTRENSSPAQETIQMSEGNQDVVYREVVFNNHNKKPKKSNEITYAEIATGAKKASQQADGLIYSEVKHNVKPKAKNPPQHTDPEETTYAEIKQKSGKAKPADGSTGLYACVDKKKKTAQDSAKT